MSTIEIKNVSKSYGKNKALDDVSLTLKENCIYGLLGRNGAGKSTLLNIVSNRIFADSGEVTVFYPDYDMDYAMKLCNEYGLDIKKRLGRLSTGYRTIAKIVNALACNAPVVFFDEPVLGLDANHRDMFYRQVVNHYNDHPATYVISTHLIEEAAGIIERAVVIKDGKLLLDEDADNVRSMGYSVSGKASDVESFIAGKDVMSVDSIGGLKTAYVKGNRANDNVPPELEAEPLSLQALFIQLTNS